MKKYIAFIIVILNSTFVFSQLNEKEDITILKKLTLEDVKQSFKSETDKGIYLTGICFSKEHYNHNVYVYKSFAGTWVLKSKFNIEDYLDYPEFEEFTSNENLIYFGILNMGGSIGNGDYLFNAYSFDENKFYSLTYSWSDGSYSSYGFKNIQTIDNEIILDYLEKKASESEYVYRPSKELTLGESWEIDNKNISERASNGETDIVFKYDDLKNILYDDSENILDYKKDENNVYIIYHYNRSMFGYNKNTGKYFMIWSSKSFRLFDDLIFGSLDNDNNLVIDTNFGEKIIHITLDKEVVFTIE